MTAWLWIAFAAGMALSLLCRMYILRTFGAYRTAATGMRRTAGWAAQQMLGESGATLQVRDDGPEGYDLSTHTLTLARRTADSASYPALCVALHECGHAWQHRRAPRRTRLLHAAYRLLVRLTLPGTLGILVGLIAGWPAVWQAGVGTYLALLSFNLVGVARECAASRHARAFAFDARWLTARQMVPLMKLLWASNLCGVASTYTAALQLTKALLALLVGRMRPREAARS